MSKAKKTIPELRFPEFKNEGEWDEKVLNQICIITNGKANTQDHVQNGKYPLFDRSEVIKASNEFLFDCESVIIPGEGVRFVPKYYEGKFNLHQRAYALKDFTCSGQFAYYSIFHRRALLSQKAVQSTVLSLRLPILQHFPIEIPKNSKEQQKIASCLSSLDEMIAAHCHKLELLKDHKKGLMQNLFPQEGEKVPKYRFGEFVNDGDWEEKTIGDFIRLHKGGAPLTPSDFVIKSDYEVIPKKAIGEGMWLNIEIPTFCSEEFYRRNEQSVVDSSYLITTLRDLVPSGPNIGYIVKYHGEKKYILAQGVYGLKLKDNLIPDFLIHFSNSNRYRKLVNAIMVGSTQVHIRNGDFFRVPLYVPNNIKEQRKIAACLSSLDVIIRMQTIKIEHLKLHKKGLMQGLFP